MKFWRYLRLEQKMQQVELARALGISKTYLNLIEFGHRPIPSGMLEDIANHLGWLGDSDRLDDDLTAKRGDECDLF